MKKVLLFILMNTFAINPLYAVEKASKERLESISERGRRVMPFNLDKTIHVFSKSAEGGLQQVLVKDKADSNQIALIRLHLLKIAKQFQQGDYSDPARIHGRSMPGLKVLSKAAKHDQINIEYKELPDGAQIHYLTDIIDIINAIHQWFDAQLSDHAHHAIDGHASHLKH